MEYPVSLGHGNSLEYYEFDKASRTPTISTSHSSSEEPKTYRRWAKRTQGESGVSGREEKTTRHLLYENERPTASSEICETSQAVSTWDIFVRACSPIAPLRVIQWDRERNEFVKSRGNNEHLHKELRHTFGALQDFGSAERARELR
ncbi:hypothetical protein R1flu_026469 [Riccia fluitans]|uniref:Uncharacterized protein n=1 Tax=Riccia fluitans TaxID=41844 RepID=A0ABD1XG30_9MARC